MTRIAGAWYRDHGTPLSVRGACNRPLPPSAFDRVTEKAWQRQVIDLAELLGYCVYHTWSSIRSQPGFPDLVLARANPPRLVFAELKTERGKLTEAQDRWLATLCAAGADAFCWRPHQLDEIAALLR